MLKVQFGFLNLAYGKMLEERNKRRTINEIEQDLIWRILSPSTLQKMQKLRDSLTRKYALEKKVEDVAKQHFANTSEKSEDQSSLKILCNFPQPLNCTL